MLGLLIMSMLWMNDPGSDYNRASNAAPAYLARAEAMRWERLRVLKMLYRGNHRQYFLVEGRTQFNYPVEVIGGWRLQRYITFNLCKLISHTTADLMLGVRPKIDASTPEQTARLDDLAKRSQLHSRLHEAVVQMSWAGGAFLEPTLWNGEPYIEVIPADEIYPQGRVQPDGQFGSYVRYATDTITIAGKDTPILLKTIYRPGVVTRELYEIDGTKLGDKLSLDQWPAYQGGAGMAAPPPEQQTGIDRCTIVYLGNKVGDCSGVSDYDGLIELQDTVNAKFAQLSRVHAKHSDPKIWFDQQSAGPDGNVRATDDAFFGGVKPDYIVWQAQCEAAERDRTAAMLAFCTAAEMSPVLLGLRQGATPDAARKLRLEATKDLSKAARKSLVLEPAISLALQIAQQLDQTTPLLRSYPIESPGVHVRDGLPVDGLDLASEASTWRAAGLMSIEDGVGMRIDDPDAQAVEVQRIENEEAAKGAPFMGAVTDQTNLGSATGEDVATPTPSQQEAA
jgi:hypothetical protein